MLCLSWTDRETLRQSGVLTTQKGSSVYGSFGRLPASNMHFMQYLDHQTDRSCIFFLFHYAGSFDNAAKRVYFAMCEKQGFLISMFLFFFPSLTNSPDPDVAWHQRLYDTWLMQTAQGFFVSAFARNPKRMDKLLPRSIPSYSKPKGWASEEKKIPTNTGFSMPRVPICSRGCGIWAVWMKPQRSNETETAAA